MTETRTLLEIAGADLTPATVDNASVVFIDIQNEYRHGPIAVSGAEAAVGAAARLLASARARDAPIVHVAHLGRPGGLFDREAERGQIVGELEPSGNEEVVEKTLPNAFARTGLQTLLDSTGRKDIILAGFMTHMCVSSTARAALDLGYRVTIDAASCGSRDLPDGRGGVIPAATVHEVALAELADRFALIVREGGSG
ncbi:MAG: isochorismatase family protein [Arenicellales bacterium]